MKRTLEQAVANDSKKETPERSAQEGVAKTTLGKKTTFVVARPAKPRRQRISKNIVFLPLDKDLNQRFRIDDDIEKSIERLEATKLMDELRRTQKVAKTQIPITSELTMVVHNVVLTTELYEKQHKDALKKSEYESEDDDLSDIDTSEFLKGLLIKNKARVNEYDSEFSSSSSSSSSSDDETARHFPQEDGEARPRIIALNDMENDFEDDDDDGFRVIQQFASIHDPTSRILTTEDLFSGSDRTTAAASQLARALTSENRSSKRPYVVPLNKLNYYLRQYGTQLNPKRFAAIILRNDELGAASLIFGSVKLVSTGCARLEHALLLMQNALDKIRATGYDDFETPVPCLRNIVSNGRFPRRICIHTFALMYGKFSKKVNKFPTVMVYHEKMGKRVALVFESGQICHSGAATIQQIYDDMCLLYPMLVNCIKTRQSNKVDIECERLLAMASTESGEIRVAEKRQELLANASARMPGDVRTKLAAKRKRNTNTAGVDITKQ